MKLIGSPGSPFVRKVRIVMAEKKIDFQFEVVDVAASHAEIQRSNPLGKVPYLVMDDGGALFDSRVIVEYLDNLTPVHKLIPANGRARAEVKTWEALADGALDAAALIRAELRRPEAQQSQAWIDKQRSKIEAALEAMSRGLGDNAFCVDAKYSLADVALGCALGYLEWRFTDLKWRERYPNLDQFAVKMFARSTFADTMPPAE